MCYPLDFMRVRKECFLGTTIDGGKEHVHHVLDARSIDVLQESLTKLEMSFNSFAEAGTMALAIALLDNNQVSLMTTAEERE